MEVMATIRVDDRRRVIKLADVDNAIVVCRGRSHKWPEIFPGRKLPKSFRPVLQRDGSVLVTETCERCGKTKSTYTGIDGVYDTGARRSYRNPPGWKVFRIEEEVTKRVFEGEMYRRMNEDLMAAARNNALAGDLAGDEEQ